MLFKGKIISVVERSLRICPLELPASSITGGLQKLRSEKQLKKTVS